MKITPLKNPLEGRVTILRVVRSLYPDMEIDLQPHQWQLICFKIKEIYSSLSDDELPLINQRRIWSASNYKRKVPVYPVEFIPIMINIIKEFIESKK